MKEDRLALQPKRIDGVRPSFDVSADDYYLQTLLMVNNVNELLMLEKKGKIS